MHDRENQKENKRQTEKTKKYKTEQPNRHGCMFSRMPRSSNSCEFFVEQLYISETTTPPLKRN
jgi:hypothetical protein